MGNADASPPLDTGEPESVREEPGGVPPSSVPTLGERFPTFAELKDAIRTWAVGGNFETKIIKSHRKMSLALMPTPPEIEAREDPEECEQQEGELDYQVIGGGNANADAEADAAGKRIIE
ncbi:hypothetical protein FN846DRAFT_908449 [Sphaerosporella brunnea]|uniref:Uncharacterized protein n=1 Tax=Sphaerosporella brunnea TaxID=1250544 RepID=A0A5J5ETK4_9PEZI|nr:hypothetical protein FN846DRAFT_908449 [Sphaerosporella brunnea]